MKYELNWSLTMCLCQFDINKPILADRTNANVHTHLCKQSRHTHKRAQFVFHVLHSHDCKIDPIRKRRQANSVHSTWIVCGSFGIVTLESGPKNRHCRLQLNHNTPTHTQAQTNSFVLIGQMKLVARFHSKNKHCLETRFVAEASECVTALDSLRQWISYCWNHKTPKMNTTK